MYTAMPKAVLKKTIKRLIEDKERGISLALFSELAGCSEKHLREVFQYEHDPLTEDMQRRVTNAYNSWKNGYVAIMKNRDNTRFVDYRRVPKPRIARSMGLDVVNGVIRLKIGIRNRSDYSGRTIDEKLRGK